MPGLLIAALGLSLFGCASLEDRIREKIEFILPVQEAQPGDVVRFNFNLPKQVKSGRVLFLDRTFALFPRKGLKGSVVTAFLSVPWDTPPGDCEITCVFRVEGMKQELRESFPFQIVPIVRSAAPEQVRSKSFDAGQWDAEQREIAGRVSKSAYPSSRLQNFLLPLGGQIRAEYGTERIFNQGAKVTMAGLEIEPLAHGNTWDVTAAAEGKVLLTRTFPMLGQVVILDHGFSFFSLYAHLQSLSVSEGQVVPRGGKLGRAGKTGGAAVGTRLWFQVFVAGVPVNVKKVMENSTR
jgi:hypothetical protein